MGTPPSGVANYTVRGVARPRRPRNPAAASRLAPERIPCRVRPAPGGGCLADVRTPSIDPLPLMPDPGNNPPDRAGGPEPETPSRGLFREEALRHHLRGAEHGDLLRMTPRWV